MVIKQVSNVARDAYWRSHDIPGQGPFTDGLTDQSQAADCDINVILKTFMKTGVLPSHGKTPMYGDFSNSPSLHLACEIVAKGNEAFDALDPKIKKRVGSPEGLIAFISDPANRVEAAKLGLLNAEATAKALASPVKQDLISAVQAVKAGTEPAVAPGQGANVPVPS